MKNYLITFLFATSCTFVFSQYIPKVSYFLADYSEAEGQTEIYRIDFEDGLANLTFLTNISSEVHIAYSLNTNLLYAINKTGNKFQYLDPKDPIPSFSDPILINVEMGDITAAAFDMYGILFLGSADQNKIYTVDVESLNTQLYDNYAPVAGGDLAFDDYGSLFLTSQIPNGFYEIFPSEISPDVFIGEIPTGSTGLAAFEDGNFLFSNRNNTFLEIRNSENTLFAEFDLFLDGEPYTLNWGDLASGYNPMEFPEPTTGCEDRRTFYADYDGETTKLYMVDFYEGVQLYLVMTLNYEAHIAASSDDFIFVVNKDGSQMELIDAISGISLGYIPLNLYPSHITAVAADGNTVYFGDQNSGKIYTIDPLSPDPQPVFFANAPLSGGDICFFGGELFLANKSLSKLFKYNETDFEEVGNLPPNVTGLTGFSHYDGTNFSAELIVSCSGSNVFYSISPDNGDVIASFPALDGNLPFSFNYGDMASYCNYRQVGIDLCAAVEVTVYDQGTAIDGNTVSDDRTYPNHALGLPEPDDQPYFVTLGYGGSIVLSMGGYIQNGPGDDLEIYETSYNTPGCDLYPEFADVSLSQDGLNWIYIGTVCKSENTLDISDATDLELFQFVKIENNDGLTSTPDGFDLNAVVAVHGCLPIDEGGYKSIEATESLDELEVFPNPSSGVSRLMMIPNKSGELKVEICDLNGRIIRSLYKSYANADEQVEFEFYSNSIPNGVYLIRMTSENSSRVEKFIVAH